MQFDYLILFAVIFFVDSVIPGPAVAMVMSRGATVGLRNTLPFIAGLVIGDLILFLFALLGVVAILKAFAPLFLILKWLGVAYLLYLAFKLWHSTHRITLQKAEPTNPAKSFGLGLILPLANPKAVGFYVALLPTILDVNELTTLTALQFCAVIIATWSLVLATYTYLASRGARHVKGGNAQLWLNRSAAVVLTGAAGAIAVKE